MMSKPEKPFNFRILERRVRNIDRAMNDLLDRARRVDWGPIDERVVCNILHAFENASFASALALDRIGLMAEYVGNGNPMQCRETLEQVEARYIGYALGRNNGNRTQAAEELGIGRRTLIRKIKQYHIK